MRLYQHWSIPASQAMVVHAYAQLFEDDYYKLTTDQGYVCDPLRSIPDAHAGWLKRVCNELEIPYKHGGNNRTWNDYKNFIKDCSFIVCPWYEASTGGMSLVEGYDIGKSMLICNSDYLGAKEYFGDRANYFEPNYESLKDSVLKLWNKRDKINQDSHSNREFCKLFSVENFCNRLVAALEDA